MTEGGNGASGSGSDVECNRRSADREISDGNETGHNDGGSVSLDTVITHDGSIQRSVGDGTHLPPNLYANSEQTSERNQQSLGSTGNTELGSGRSLSQGDIVETASNSGSGADGISDEDNRSTRISSQRKQHSHNTDGRSSSSIHSERFESSVDSSNIDILDLRRAHQQRQSEIERLSALIARHERQQKELEELKHLKTKALKTLKKSLVVASKPFMQDKESESQVLSTSKDEALDSVLQNKTDTSRSKDENIVVGPGDSQNAAAADDNDDDDKDSTERDIDDEQLEDDDISIAIQRNPMIVLKILFKEFLMSVSSMINNFRWRQTYYFYIHLASIIFTSFVGGVLLWLSENFVMPSQNRPYLRFIDAWFMSVSSHCVTGLIVVDFSLFSRLGQVISLGLMVLGGLTLTCIPALIIKIIRARNRMIIRRKQLHFSDFDELHRRTLEAKAHKLFSGTQRPVIEAPKDKALSKSQSQGAPHQSAAVSQHIPPVVDADAAVAVVDRIPFDEMDHPPIRATFDVQFDDGTDDEPARKTYDVERRNTSSTEGTKVKLEEDEGEERTGERKDEKRDDKRRVSKLRRRKRRKRQKSEDGMSQRQRKRIKDILSYRPPPATDIEYLALRAILFIVVFTGLSTVMISFLILSVHLQISYTSQQLDGMSPWWVGLFLAITGFNNVGIAPFPDNMARFISDPLVCLLIAFLIMVGNTCFPAVIRMIVYMLFRFGPKRHKLIFKYLLLNHHHLTHHLYPSLQTRLYLMTTLVLQALGIAIAFSLDFWDAGMLELSVGTRLLVIVFHTVSTRAAGFTTFDISQWSEGTLLFYMIMMRIKPQMACALNERAYGIAKVIGKFYGSRERQRIISSIKKYDTVNKHSYRSEAIDLRNGPKQHTQVQFEVSSESDDGNERFAPRNRSRLESNETTRQRLPSSHYGRDSHHSLTAHRISTPSQIPPDRECYEDAEVNDIIDDILDYGDYGDDDQEASNNDDNDHETDRPKLLEFLARYKRQLKVFFRSAIMHIRNLFLENNVWIFIFMLIICMLESHKIKREPAHFSFFKVAFEIISAFGNVGMSLGYRSLNASFSAMLTDVSKLLIMVTIVLGRHRGLLGSMKDQEYQDFTVKDIVNWWYEERKQALEKEQERQLQQDTQKSIQGTAHELQDIEIIIQADNNLESHNEKLS